MTPDPDLSSPMVRRLGSAVNGVRRVASDGAGQLIAWELKLPPDASRMRQLVHGLWLPLVIARAVLADRRVRARWLRYSVAQVIATVVVAVLMLAIGGRGGTSGEDEAVGRAVQGAVAELRERVDARAEELERHAPPAERKLIKAEKSLIDDRLERMGGRLERSSERALAPDALPLMLSRALDDAALERAASRRSRISAAAENLDGMKLAEELVRQGERLASLGGDSSSAGTPAAAAPKNEQNGDSSSAGAPAAAASKDEQNGDSSSAGAPAAAVSKDELDGEEEALAKILEAGSAKEARAPALSPEQAAQGRRVRSELKAAALAGGAAAQEKLDAALPWYSRLNASWHVIGWLVALWGVLYVAQFVVIALCRDYHDELSREACLLTGLAPEDPPISPRPRFNLRWAWTRVKRYFRGWLVVTLGLPVCWLVSLPFPGDVTRNVLIGAWVLYWQVVFAASKSARAWVDEFVAPPPWFIRAWRWVVEKVPLAWMLGAGVYGGLWARYTRGLYAPAECVEQQPAAFAGLTIFRLVGSLPLVKVFIRPLVPVASALLLEAYRERHPARTAPAVLLAKPVL